MTNSQFIDSCLERNREYLERGRRAADDIPLDRLNHRAVSGFWSPAQIYRHLALANTPYEAKMAMAVKSLPLDATNQQVQTTWFGGFIAKQAGPGTNAPAPRAMVPPDEPLPASVVEEWATQYARLIEVIESAKSRDLNKKFMKNPILPLFSMTLADCILIMTNHTQRHIEQIEQRLAGSC